MQFTVLWYHGSVGETPPLVGPSWKIDEPEAGTSSDYGFTAQRRANLLALGEKNKESITPETMMTIMSTPLEQGGAFRSPNLTSYQIVAVPADLKMWVRIPQVVDWIGIDLKPLFG